MSDLFGGPGTSDIRREDKLIEMQRELVMRFHVYPKLVANRKLSQHEADRRILVVQAIIEDYQFAEPADNRARRTDPETSHAAARKSNAGKSKTDQLILGDLDKHLEKGGTTLEISKRVNKPHNNMSPRFKPLEEAGLIFRAGRRRDPGTQCDSIVWRIR